jgi:hypothetical protein
MICSEPSVEEASDPIPYGRIIRQSGVAVMAVTSVGQARSVPWLLIICVRCVLSPAEQE